MTRTNRFRQGLHELGNGSFAWLQPDGGWGLSNTGLISDGTEALLVDTLIDLPRTRTMLTAMQAALPAGSQIRTVVNTHSHPDHTAGNALLPEATVIASRDTLKEMQRMGSSEDLYGKILGDWRNYGEAGTYLHEVMGSRFELDLSRLRLPDLTFDTEWMLQVGSRAVRLTKLGPAHSQGDVVVYLPDQRVLYTGDVLFHEVHPAVSNIPVSNWIAVCDRLLEWDIEHIVPGHGPLTDLTAVKRQRDYFVYFQEQARRRFEAGLSLEEAARDIALDAFRGWADEERIVMTLAGLYRDLGAPPSNPVDVLGMAYRYRRAQQSKI